MSGFDRSSRHPTSDGKPIRPWDVGGREQEEEKVVEFPSAARAGEEEPLPVDDDLDVKVEEQLQRLRSAKREVEGSIRKHREKLDELDSRSAQFAADMAEMRVALANIDSQIRELEVLGELIRGLQRER